MKWEPWKDFKADPEVLPILGPPCPACFFWKPQRTTRETYHDEANQPGIVGAHFDGVRCCWKMDMSHDFSCYKPKDR